MENTGFNSFDIAAISVLIISGVFALRRGLVGEIMALGTWIIASVFTFSFFPLVRPLIDDKIQNGMLADAATGLGLFCLAIIVLVPVCDFLNDFVKGPTFSSVDRSLGFVFGLLRGFIIMCLIFMIMIYIWPEDTDNNEETSQPEWLANAKTKPAFSYGVDLLKSLVPEDTDEQIAQKLKESRDEAKKAKDNAKLLEEMSMPVPSFPDAKNKTQEFYEDNIRDDMNNFFDRNSEE